jgi:hypothetical protein
MSCSIHLGNYILVVPQPPQKDGSAPSLANHIPVSTADAKSQEMGALSFEIAWFRFLREAEEEY